MLRRGALAVGAAAAVAVADDPAGRLNPNQKYLIANGPAGQLEMGFQGEYFEVDSPPIRSRYSEVVWKGLPSVPLPSGIVSRFAGKVMAITGYEVNVLRNTSEGEVSVPCYESYNHHYNGAISGAGVDVAVIDPTPEEAPPLGLSHGELFRLTPNGRALGLAPTYAHFSEHNGNEARQTYHGLPSGYIRGVESPRTFSFSPMQINTRNPDGSGRRCNGNCPLPRASNAPPNATWSGIIECPCTTRVKKEISGHFTEASGECKGRVGDATECFAAAAQLLGSKGKLTDRNISDASQPAGCFVEAAAGGGLAAVFNAAAGARAACEPPAGQPPRLVGRADSVVSLTVDVDGATGMATITLSVNDSAAHWYGVGFNTSQMNGAYAIVVDGEGKVTERVLGDHTAGETLSPSPGLTIVSQHAEGGARTTVLRRPLRGSGAGRYSFSTSAATLPFIAAVGSTPDLAQHRARAPGTLSLVSIGAPTCICRGGTGKINGFAFNPQCLGEPKSDLLATNNPTCDINLYAGGMSCCRGGVFLLDADQEIPPLEDEVFFRWRFYYEEYQPAVHIPTFHLEWQSGHIEYDVPRAKPGTPPAETVHTLETRFSMRDWIAGYGSPPGGNGGWPMHGPPEWYADTRNASRKIALVAGGFHCHSPGCLGGELINADTGELLCEIRPVLGSSAEAKDEETYLWIPPCQWGNPKDGLKPPPLLTLDTNLTSIKRANNTYGHYGVMAIWQSRAAMADNIPWLKDIDN